MSGDYFSEEQIRQVLQPLQSAEFTTNEYQHQYEMASEFQRKLRNLEFLYGEVYSQVKALEEKYG